MTHQPTDALAQPDARIDQVLEALRTTVPPAGIEHRIAARLTQAAETRQASAPEAHTIATSHFAVILNAVKDPCILFAEARLYTLAAALTLLLTLTTIAILHHRTPTTTASTTITLTPTSSPSLEGAGLQSRRNTPTRNPALAAEATSHLTNTQVPQAFNLDSHPSLANTQVPRGFSLGSHSPIQRAGVLTPAPAQQPDLDTIALAETLAPSHPAPPMPLTSEERLMLAATRPGQPIEVAELDMARAPFLRAAAQAREDANLRRYVRTLLAPFAVADELSPTTVSHPREINTQAPAPQPPTSLTN